MHILFTRWNSFFFNDTAPTEIYTLSLHDALPITAPSWPSSSPRRAAGQWSWASASTSPPAPTSCRRPAPPWRWRPGVRSTGRRCCCSSSAASSAATSPGCRPSATPSPAGWPATTSRGPPRSGPSSSSRCPTAPPSRGSPSRSTGTAGSSSGRRRAWWSWPAATCDTCAHRPGRRDRRGTLRHPVRVAYPDKLLAEDEEVVRHLHPHWLTLVRPVLVLLLVVGGTSFGAALVPGGASRGTARAVLAGLALVVLVVAVLRPVLRWRTTHYVVTTHRVLLREGVLARRGRDIALSRIADVSYRQTLGQRLVRSGTLTIESLGEGGTTVLERVPGSDGVQQLLVALMERTPTGAAAPV